VQKLKETMEKQNEGLLKMSLIIHSYIPEWGGGNEHFSSPNIGKHSPGQKNPN